MVSYLIKQNKSLSLFNMLQNYKTNLINHNMSYKTWYGIHPI